VCHESLCDPVRTLPCLHSACLECLDKWISHSSQTFNHFPFSYHDFNQIVLKIKSKIGKAPFKCPMCRAVFEIPATAPINETLEGPLTAEVAASSASSLPVNHFVSTFIAAAASSASSLLSLGKSHDDPNNVICEGCEENEASEYCKDWSMAFCLTCKKPHLKIKSAAHHQFISLHEALKPGSGSGSGPASKVMYCEKHPHLEINTYCLTDQQAICAECVVDLHVGHQVERLVNVAQGFKEEISQLAIKVFFLLSPCFPSSPSSFQKLLG